MLVYALIFLCLSLAGVTGVQMMYMFYIDRLDKQRKKRVHELEMQCRSLTRHLREAEERIEEQDEVLDSLSSGTGEEEAWADLLDDR